MGLGDIVTWYQKKIGTYDKQQWEKTIEQRILHGLTHVPMKTTKLKTELIDVDLVRGSSFPKAKPKHGFMTVTRLGTFRMLLLPLFAKWWVKQTSPRIFVLLLVLYLLQSVNTAVYTYNLPKKTNDAFTQHNLSPSEIIVPLLMMLILSIIHSQIVATNPGPDNPRSPFKKARKLKARRRKVIKLKTNASSENNKNSHETENVCVTTVQEATVHDDNVATKHVTIVANEIEEKIVVKRNVVWDSPVKSNMETNQNSVETSETDMYISANENTDSSNKQGVSQDATPLDDDGFESLNGNGSSENSTEAQHTNISEENISVTNKGKEKCEAWVQNIETSTNYLRRRRSVPDCCREHSTDNESDGGSEAHIRTHSNLLRRRCEITPQRKINFLNLNVSTATTVESSGCDSEEGECEMSSPGTAGSFCPLLTEATTSATEWMGVTTNSEDCTYSSAYDESDSHSEMNNNFDQSAWDYDLAPTVILNPSCAPSDKVSCTIWTHQDVKKADLTVLDISSAIIERVEAMPESLDYFYGGIVLSVLLSLVPAVCRLGDGVLNSHAINETQMSVVELISLSYEEPKDVLLQYAFGTVQWEHVVTVISLLERCILGSLFFFLLAVAERTFKQRFLYAKLFLHLTSSRRARKSNLPHFRLNKVRNIKTWLSVRSYLKMRGPQRSVDMIVSAAFIINLLLLTFICIELIKDSVALHSQYNLEVMLWSFSIGIYILRFMTLGAKINRKYRNLSVLITEQINLYLQIEQKPHKKEELMVANSVLKLAADLLKELESPFKISGLSANPYLYTITRVVILSALSGVLSEVLGFKLKLFKIKFK